MREPAEPTWIQKLPKVSLHDHLDGGLRPETLIELAAKVGYRLPETEPKALARWFYEAATSRSLERYLQTFSHTVAVMQTAENLRKVAYDHVLTLAADGVIYGEVRWAPELHTAGGLSMEEAVEAVADGLMDGMEYIGQMGGRVLVNQILCAMRQNNRATDVARLTVKYRQLGVVGFDLAGPEAGYPADQFSEAFELLAQNFVPVTLHAGEADGLESIRSALVAGRALRLGHGVRITEDMTTRTVAELDPDGTLMPGADRQAAVLQLGQVADWVKNRRVVLECCPCSNLQTDAAETIDKVGTGAPFEPAREYQDHPLPLLFSAGFAVTVNPDNRLMSATSMSREFAELAQHAGYGIKEFFDLTMNAVAGAFCTFDEKRTLEQSVQLAYAQIAQELENEAEGEEE
ncbi:MAG: adenosine deaminase [Rothia sp. (in: high G+C Gram-positive bacteria)]|nr:adenosine deaminase [Rothia sp. (in: high G+C Gram-positive bacteria)]